MLPSPVPSQCNILAESICKIILKDTFTVLFTIWAALQLTWVTMLVIVQTVQIARGLTTFETMFHGRHSTNPGGRPAEAITSALTAGTTTLSGAELTASRMGPDPALPRGGHRHGHANQKQGFFATWTKLLGLDTFLATAQGSAQARRKKNPFSRGVVRNCKDFWLDPAPYFRSRENGAAMLDGEVVNYARMYEPPPRMKYRGSSGRAGGDGAAGLYHSVAGDDAV